jgi:2-phosphosulfolactate phosphatase
MRSIDVALTPELVMDAHDRDLVAIDVLRATTTMLAAFGSGAARIIPVETVGDALTIKGDLHAAILCGERNAVPPEGFDTGNSPLAMTPDRVGDRTLVMSTTNGTRAIHRCAGAARVCIGAITNRAALAQVLSEAGRDVTLVCSGTHGRVSLDDTIGAGLILERLLESGSGWDLTDAARVTLDTTRAAIDEHGSIGGAIGSAAHGRRLVSLGMNADIEYAARIDSSERVPIWDPEHNEIRVR